MRTKALLLFPLAFALVGSVIFLVAGNEIEIAGTRGTFMILQWHFVLLGLIFNTLLYLLYRWLFGQEVSVSLFWLHLVSIFGGMTIFLYLVLPWGDGQDIDAMLRGLTWMLSGSFLLLVGIICLIILVFKRLGAGRTRENPDITDEHSDQETVDN